jgi:UDP-GlcNAc:undecaprenyl-phosphate GlcNAc-1-phosphate transferase
MNRMALQFLAMFGWGALVTPLSISLARRFRLLDTPGTRKIHSGVIPRGAGIVLWLGYLLWVLLMGWPLAGTRMIAIGSTLVFLVGYVDDMKPTSPFARLSFHLVAALAVVVPLHSSPLAKAFLVLWIAGCTNAYNLIDGMDGLCLSLAIATAGILSFFAGLSPWLPLAALCSGVLLWNFPFPRARTFLGDGGSTLLGFLCASQMATGLPVADVDPMRMLPILALLGGIPVLDTLVAVCRRLAGGRSPFLPDRGHLHHRLLDRSFSVPAIIVTMGAMHLALLLAGLGLLGLFPGSHP